MSDFTLPSMEKLQRAIARDLVDIFRKEDLDAVYARASQVAPKLYPNLAKTATARSRATDLIADCFLLLGEKLNRG